MENEKKKKGRMIKLIEVVDHDICSVVRIDGKWKTNGRMIEVIEVVDHGICSVIRFDWKRRKRSDDQTDWGY